MTSNTSCLTASSRAASCVTGPRLTAEHEHNSAARRGLAAFVHRDCIHSTGFWQEEQGKALVATRGPRKGTGTGLLDERRTGALRALRGSSCCLAGASFVPIDMSGGPRDRPRTCIFARQSRQPQCLGRICLGAQDVTKRWNRKDGRKMLLSDLVARRLAIELHQNSKLGEKGRNYCSRARTSGACAGHPVQKIACPVVGYYGGAHRPADCRNLCMHADSVVTSPAIA